MGTQKVEKQKPTHPWKSTTHEERFYHFHDHGTRVRPSQNEAINAVMHEVALVLDRTKFSHVTVFARKEKLGSGEPGWFFSIAMRARSDPETFSRRVGRSVARRKYFAQAYHRRPLGEDLDHRVLVERVIQLVNSHNHPPMHPKAYPGR